MSNCAIAALKIVSLWVVWVRSRHRRYSFRDGGYDMLLADGPVLKF